MIGQREKIHAILRSQDDWLGSLEILRICHSSHDERINKINIEPIRRCLQELLAKGLVKKDDRNIDLPLWLGVPHE